MRDMTRKSEEEAYHKRERLRVLWRLADALATLEEIQSTDMGWLSWRTSNKIHAAVNMLRHAVEIELKSVTPNKPTE